MMEEIKAALEKTEQEIERCDKRLKEAKADLVRARERRNAIIGTYITDLGGGDAKSLDAFFALAQETLSAQKETATGTDENATDESAAQDSGRSGEV